MKARTIIITLVLFTCCNVFGQKQDTKQEETDNHTPIEEQVSTPNYQKTFVQLQEDNESTNKLLLVIEKEMEVCREDVRNKTSEMNTNMAIWFAALTIVMAILGVAVPLLLNRKNEKNMDKVLDDVKQEVESAKHQAEQAREYAVGVEDLKKHVDAIEKRINEDALAAEESAKNAKVSQLFMQAFSLASKDEQKAAELYSEVIKIKPDLAEAYNNRAVLHCNSGNYEKAIDDCNNAIKYNPKDASAYNNKAYALMKLGDFGRALDYVNKAIELDGGAFAFWDTKGEICLNMEKYEEAIWLYTKALSLNENFKQSLVNRANCYKKLAENEKDSTKKIVLLSKADADGKKAETIK